MRISTARRTLFLLSLSGNLPPSPPSPLLHSKFLNALALHSANNRKSDTYAIHRWNGPFLVYLVFTHKHTQTGSVQHDNMRLFYEDYDDNTGKHMRRAVALMYVFTLGCRRRTEEIVRMDSLTPERGAGAQSQFV